MLAGAGMQKNKLLGQASASFMAIGALLIPFVGIGWHAFVLSQDPFNFGVWFSGILISAICLFLYAGLAFMYSSKNYSYAMILSSLAVLVSSVQMNNMPYEWVILGVSFLNIVYFLAAYLDNKYSTSHHQYIMRDEYNC